MATEAHIPEFISITKGEEEEKNLTKVQLDATSYENYPGELKNVDGALDDPPKIFECSKRTENMQVAKDIDIETMSTVNKGNVGTSEGEIFLESPSVSKVAHEDTSRVLDDCHVGEIPDQAEKEAFKLQKYKKLEDAETGEVESQDKKEIKEGEDQVAHELGETNSQTNTAPIQRELEETGFVGGKDKEPEKHPILLSKENDHEAEQREHGIDEGNKISYGGGQDVSMTTVAGSTEETTFQEAGIEEKSQDTMALSEKIKDMNPIEGNSQDQNKLDIPFVTCTEDIGLQKVENPETLTEVLETGREGINIKEIPDEKVALNEKIKCEEAKREKASKTYSEEVDYGFNIEGEIKEMHSGQNINVEMQEKEEACDPDISLQKVENPETLKEVSEIARVDINLKEIPDEKNLPQVDLNEKIESDEAEREKVSETYSEEKNYGFNSEGDITEKHSGQNIDLEMQEKEEACDPDIGLQKVENPETLKEVSETGREDINIKEIPDEKVDLNEKIECEEAEREKASKTYSKEIDYGFNIEGEIKEMHSGQNIDVEMQEKEEACDPDIGLLKLENPETLKEVSETGREDINIKEIPDEKNLPQVDLNEKIESEEADREKASETYSEAIDYGFNLEGEIKEKHSGQNTDVVIQEKEEACDPEKHKSATKSIKDEDVPARASDPECIGNETIERSFQVYYLDEVPSALAGDGNGNKVEDDVEKDNIIPREVNDEINITGTTYDTREQITEESNVTKGSPETIEEETVKSFLDGEMPLLAADKSRGEDNNEQAIADTYKGTQESNKEEIFVDIEKEDEACKKEIFESYEMSSAAECVESEKIPDVARVEPKESLQDEGENQVPVEDPTEGKRNDHIYSLNDEDNDDSIRLSKGEETTEWISEKDETGGKLEQSLNAVSKVTEAINSEYTEYITNIKEEKAIQDVEKPFEKEEREDTKDSKEVETVSEEDLVPVTMASEMSKSTENPVLELKAEKDENPLNINELAFEERIKENDAIEDTEEVTKKEETYDPASDEVETTCDDTEKSKIEEDAVIKDGNTVWIEEETVELSGQEDEGQKNGTEQIQSIRTVLNLNGGDHSIRTDTETENSSHQIIKEIAAIIKSTEKHTIEEEHTTIDVSPQSSGEETHNFSQDETKEERKNPKAETCEELDTTTIGEGIRGQILEGDTIQDHSTLPIEAEETEDNSKENEMMTKTPKPGVSEISQRYHGVQDIQKDIEEGTTKKGYKVEENQEKPEREDKDSVEPGEKSEGAPESAAKDLINEALLETNQMQIKENRNNVQDQKSKSVEVLNIEHGVQKDEKDTYMETTSRLDAGRHIDEMQNADETISERTVDSANTISEVPEEINKETLQEAETCYNKFRTATETVETEETSSWEAQLDENSVQGIKTSSKEKTQQTSAGTSQQDEVGESVKPEETTELMSQLLVIAGDNADEESNIVEKLHIFESREECVEENVDTQKTLNAEELEGISKEEIKGASETVTECNYQDVKEDIKDEIDVIQMDSAGKSEDRHQETCTALPSEEWDLGITATIGYPEHGKEKEGETPQNENPEDSLAARTTEEICLPKDTARELEIFGLEPKLNESIQHINRNEPFKEECIILDEIPQAEPQENVSAIKYPKSPTESDTVMEVTKEEPKRVEKAEEESENVEEPIIKKETGTDGFPAVSIEDESIDKEQHTEILSSLTVIDPEVQTEKVNLEVAEDFSKEPEGSHVTNATEEEMRQNQGGDKKVDISSSASETSEEINKQAIEGRDTCSNNTDTASAKVETEEISCRDAQLDDKQIQNIETGLEDITLQNNTTETSPQDEDVNIKLEETSEEVSQLPAIACENKDEESEIVEKPQVDEVEEIKGASDTVFESKEPCIQCSDETQKRPTIEESEGIFKEEIKGPSETVSRCHNQDVEVVVEDEIDVIQTAAVETSEEQHQETCTSLSSILSKEQDLGITATIGCSEDGKAKEGQTPQNENLEDSFPTKTTDEIFLLKEEPRELSGFGLKLNENIQQINPNEPLKEECSSLDEVSQLKAFQENVSAFKHSDSLTERDKVMELLEQVPKEVDKVAEESEIIKETIIDNERGIKDFPAVEEDESINKEQHSETGPSDSSIVIDSKVQTEESQEVVEDFSKDLEGSLITKTMEKKVNVSSSLSEISEADKQVTAGTDACSNNMNTTSEKVETEDTSLQEAQSDDREIKITQTSSEDKTLRTNNITETSSQDEVDNIMLEETSEEVSQIPATNKESEIIEKPPVDKVEETKGASDIVSESREPLIEDNGGMPKRLTVQESEGISKEEIKGPSDTVFGSTNQGVEAAVEDKTDVFQVATMGKSGDSHQETSKVLFSEEQDHGMTVVIECLEDVIAKKDEKEDIESSLATKTKEVCLQKEKPRELEISGLGQDTNEDVQKNNPNEPPREEFNAPTEEILLEMDENCHKASKFEHGKIEKVSDSVFEVHSKVVEKTTVGMEMEAYNHGSEASSPENNDNLTKEAPEEAKKLVESENIEKLMMQKQGDIEEPATISVDDESVKVQHDIVPGKNLRAADLNTQIEKVNQDAAEDFSQDLEGSLIIKALEEQMPQVEDSEQPVDISSSIYEISKETASEKAETEGTSMQEAQLNDKHINIIETSSEDKELKTKTTFETHPEDVVSSLQPQENISKIKCTDPPMESDGVMELKNEVPEVAEKVVKRENIKELIMEKERHIKELSAVSVDESVIKVQVDGPISNENLGVTETNMPIENLNFKAEDLSKEPKGSSITKALGEEMLEEQDDEKAMNVHSSEMQEEDIKEIMEKADIPNSKLDTASEKGETEESSSQEAQLDDNALKIIESSSKDKALKTNTFAENSPQDEGVDCVKHEETLELVSQLPAHAFDDANKVSETVENPHTDEIEETKGASTVSESKEQCAEENDETQNSSTEPEVDIIKEQVKGAPEIEPESKYQVIESVIEEEIAAGQAIKSEEQEEQLEEVSTTILSKQQEHGINTIIENAEDENIKEGETSQYENPEDSFDTEASKKICLQKEESRKLVISGLGLEINEDVLKEYGTSVDGVSENISETTKNDENLDSGIILKNSPRETILHEVGENCEEAPTLKCENFEKVSEPVLDLHSYEIDEAVVVLEAGAHIHGSDAFNSETITREVLQGAEKSIEGENIKGLNIEKESDTKELPSVTTENETFDKTETTNLEVKDPEGSPISEILQEEISEKQASEKTAEVTNSVSEMPEKFFRGKTINEADTCCSKLDTTSETEVAIEVSLQEGQLDDTPPKGIQTSAAEKITTAESSPQSEEIDSLKFEEASALKPQLPTVACERADKDKIIVENPDADEVEELSHTVSESRELHIEKIVEIQESPALEKSEKNIIKEEIKGSSEKVSECKSPSSEAFSEDEISANQTIEAEKPKVQLQETYIALISEEKDHGISTKTRVLEDKNMVEVENLVKDKTPQYDNKKDIFVTKMTEEKFLYEEEFKDLEESNLELKDDVQKKTTNEELKEGDNALYRITPLEPQKDALDIKCQDSLAGDMELIRSMDSTLDEGTKDDKDLDSVIFIKNVDDALSPYSSGEEILQAADENYKEPSNFEGEKIEKSSESMSQIHSDEVDIAATDLEAGSHKHGSEAPSNKNNDNFTEKNIELADINEKLEGAEGQCSETLPETNQKQVDEDSSSADKQNIKSIEEQIIGQGLQEYQKETDKETKSSLESSDHIHVIQNENETMKDVISAKEVSGGTEKAEERENIQEHIIEEKKDNKDLLAVSIKDRTIVKEKSSEPASCESFTEAESNQKTRELNLDDEEDLCEKPVDVSGTVFELSEKGVKGEIIDEADNYNKLDTEYEKVEAEKTVSWEPQLDDDPLKGTDTALEEKTPQINKPTETILGDEEAEAVKLANISDLVAQRPTAAHDHAHKESVIVEEPQADEVEETKRAFNTTSEFRDPCIREIDETQRSLTMEKLEEQKIEEEITGKSRESPKPGNSGEQLQEMSIAMPCEEKEPEITTTIRKSEAENKKENEENVEDSLGTEYVEEKCFQKGGLGELEDSALTAKHSNIIQKESPKEARKEEGKPQESVSGIEYLDSIIGREEVMKLTRSIHSSSQEASKEEEILDSGDSNNKADNFSIPNSSVEILEKIQEQCEKPTNLESEKIEKASEYAPRVHYPEAIIKLEEPEVKEEHLKTLATEMRAEEIPHEKTIGANEKIAEERQVAEDHQPESLDEETIGKSLQEDELKNAVEYDKLYEESERGKATDNIEKQFIDEARTIENPLQASFRDESVRNNLPEGANGERNDKETDIKLDLVNQSDATAHSKQADCSDIQLMKKDLDMGDAFDNKAVVITKDEDLKPNFNVLAARSASKEEASHKKEAGIGDISESVSQEPVHETTRRNEEIATIDDYSESFMENKLHIQTPQELACKVHNVSEGLKLKDPEVATSERDASPLSETSWEEIPGKESVITDEERQHDLTSGKQIKAESISTEEKGANDEAKRPEGKGKHTRDEEQREFLASSREGKLEEAEIHSTTDGAIHSQIEKLSASSQAICSNMEISEREVHMDIAEAIESSQDNKQLEKGSDETSKKHILREQEPSESVEVMISSGKEGVHLASQDLRRKTFQKHEVVSQEAISEVEEKDSGGEKTMVDMSEEPDVNSTPKEPAVSWSDLPQKSMTETLQPLECQTEEQEPMAKEDMPAKEEEATVVQEAETHEDIDEEEEGDENKKDDSGSDAPVIVEASRDVIVKDGHKKSHNILSGVGSKVKHSIAKVKKAITGKSSSHHKHSSPKEKATKAKEQK